LGVWVVELLEEGRHLGLLCLHLVLKVMRHLIHLVPKLFVAYSKLLLDGLDVGV